MNLPFARALLASAAVVVAVGLAGCDPDTISVTPTGRSQTPISERTLADMQAKRMDKDSPILIRIFKEESEMEVWKKSRDGEFALLKTYPICRWSGDLGPKKKVGDRQAPEGFYTITPGQMNPNSNYYLAFNTGYPNTYDRAWGFTGSDLMVHGDCSSRGCYAMTDEQIQEIYSLARESFFGGQKSFQLQAFPFRMTAVNMARHRNNANFAFWKMIKEGYDHFEATHQEPKVAVCEKRYVFDAAAPGNASRSLSFNARGACPVFQLDPTIASAVLNHRRQEQYQMAQLIARDIDVVPPRTGIDGGMNPVFEAQLRARSEFDNDGRVYVASGAAAPGALPRSAVPPTMTFATTRPAPKIQGVLTASVPQTLAKPAANEQLTLRGTNTDLAAKPKRTAPVYTASAAPPRAKTAEAVPPAAEAAARAPAPTPPAIVQQARDEQRTPEAAPELRTAYSAPPASSGMLKGAQPVIPADTFESRWTALR